jgi:hypothetical protein
MKFVSKIFISSKMAVKGSVEDLDKWKTLGLGSYLALGGCRILGFPDKFQLSSKLLAFFLASIRSFGLASFRKNLNWTWKELRLYNKAEAGVGR